MNITIWIMNKIISGAPNNIRIIVGIPAATSTVNGLNIAFMNSVMYPSTLFSPSTQNCMLHVIPSHPLFVSLVVSRLLSLP